MRSSSLLPISRTLRSCSRPLLVRGIPLQWRRQFQLSTTRYQNKTPEEGDDSRPVLGKVDPQLMLAFTCKVCNTRSSHTLSKQGYEKGSVLIQCPGCKNRHLIADNLRIFRDNNFNLEQVLKLQGDSFSTSVGDLVFEDLESLKKAMEKVKAEEEAAKES
ncbi:uncharacterized protein KQ657_001711 [Scheffersomyces spartinae]|uniref:DNL-type domain-containing protein n=1 Tax=Scheffersomyces spartinae TaxID=45513 RepID=A0A9P8AHA6_9ASCO|nr:uncharacterized protein KQ657_001711 [Scheffersomyces spartinae]KAG7192611.1 hypothetical protein KQ657_001711 [Scheffersomyces spartinae]